MKISLVDIKKILISKGREITYDFSADDAVDMVNEIAECIGLEDFDIVKYLGD